MKNFWQHENGKVYAVESDSFGHILGADGPIQPDRIGLLDDYDYGPGIVDWVARAIGCRKLHRINP